MLENDTTIPNEYCIILVTVFPFGKVLVEFRL